MAPPNERRPPGAPAASHSLTETPSTSINDQTDHTFAGTAHKAWVELLRRQVCFWSWLSKMVDCDFVEARLIAAIDRHWDAEAAA